MQIDLYRRWAATSSEIDLILERRELDAVIDSWLGDRPQSARRVGLVPLMENADPIREPAEAAFWAEQGVRLVGPAWHSNRYTGDTEDGGPLTPLGRELIAEMGKAQLALDITHMSEQACLEALDVYQGVVVASHAHSQRTVATPRLLSDRVIEGIVARDGIIGVMPVNWALRSGWEPDYGKAAVTLDAVVDAIDAVCQIAGDAHHVGLGTRWRTGRRVGAR